MERFISQVYKNRMIVKFALSGITAAVADFSLLFLLHGVLSIDIIIAASLGFLAAFFISFYLQKFWTFRDESRKRTKRQVVIYFSVGLLNLSINAFSVQYLVEEMGVWYIMAQAIIGSILSIGNYIVYKFIIFKKRKEEKKKILAESNKTRVILATGIYGSDIGGPAKYVKKLKEELVKNDFEVKIITYGEGESSDDVLYVNRGQNIFFRYLAFFNRLRKIVWWADVVYAFDLVSVGIPCVLTKIALPRTKIITRIGGDFVWEKAINNQWTDRPLSSYYQGKKNFTEKILIRIHKFVLRRNKRIIFSTKWQRDIYIEQFKLKKERTIVIENPFPDTGEIKSEEEKKEKKIVFAGRLIRLKNIERLLVGFKKDPEFKLQIIGDGPDKERLECMSEKMNIKQRVSFEPGIEHDELLKKIRESYLVVVPSISEVSPNIVLEAIKLGTPVVLTRECGFYEKYKDRLIFFDPLSSEDMYQKIKPLFEEEGYKKYLNKIKSIDSSRGWQDVSRESNDLLKKIK